MTHFDPRTKWNAYWAGVDPSKMVETKEEKSVVENLKCAACEQEIELGVLVTPVYRTFMSRGGRTIILTAKNDDDDILVAHYPSCTRGRSSRIDEV